MLFNSLAFLVGFMPIVLAGYAALAALRAHRLAIAFLALASLFFYSWWNPAHLPLILASIAFNFVVGRSLARTRSRALLALGVAANLALLGWFKYAMFFAAQFGWSVGEIALPLAISFFTFQQIAYLVDACNGKSGDGDIWDYALFVSFFPQLIAGPIVHHREMMPQFARRGGLRLRWRDVGVGLTVFAIGLFKKVMIADSLDPAVDNGFASADDIDFLSAWGAATGWGMQIYFDFSGYSDMAIGLGRMFGIRLPLNFNSPYKAGSIIDFWRRWHITLSRFLRDYLYVPLGGNRRGRARRYVNLLTTMLLGGLWHGAAWTFVVWGALHGLYLAVNHGWRALWRGRPPSGPFARAAGWAVTFAAVTVAWVFFRAADFAQARAMLEGMAGLNGFLLPSQFEGALGAVSPALAKAFEYHIADAYSAGDLLLTFSLVLFALVAPNTQEIMRAAGVGLAPGGAPEARPARPALRALSWRPHPAYGAVFGAAFALAFLYVAAGAPSEFIYFHF